MVAKIPFQILGWIAKVQYSIVFLVVFNVFSCNVYIITDMTLENQTVGVGAIWDNYCKQKGNGCHKESKHVYNGITFKDIKVCCCDTDL